MHTRVLLYVLAGAAVAYVIWRNGSATLATAATRGRAPAAPQPYVPPAGTAGVTVNADGSYGYADPNNTPVAADDMWRYL